MIQRLLVIFSFALLCTPQLSFAQQTINCPGGLEDALNNRRTVRFVTRLLRTNVYRVTPIWSVTNCFMAQNTPKRSIMSVKFEPALNIPITDNNDGTYDVDISKALNTTVAFEHKFSFVTELESGAPHPNNGTQLKPTQLRYQSKFENELIYGIFNQLSREIGITSQITFYLTKDNKPQLTPTATPTPQPTAQPTPQPTQSPKSPDNDGGTDLSTLMNLLVQLLAQLMQVIQSIDFGETQITRSVTSIDATQTASMITELIRTNKKQIRSEKSYRKIPRLAKRFERNFEKAARTRRLKQKARLLKKSNRILDRLLKKATK